jgi:hypothetical protein
LPGASEHNASSPEHHFFITIISKVAQVPFACLRPCLTPNLFVTHCSLLFLQLWLILFVHSLAKPFALNQSVCPILRLRNLCWTRFPLTLRLPTAHLLRASRIDHH